MVHGVHREQDRADHPGGRITEFDIPTPVGRPFAAIAVGPDGNLWFTELFGNKIGRITTAGAITEYPIPTAASTPYGIAAGPDGGLWFTQAGGNKIGRITSGRWPPVMAGSGQVGLPLVCDASSWGPTAEVSLAWRRNGTVIPGQTGLSYTPTAEDVTQSIACTGTTLLAGMLAAFSMTSNEVVIVPQSTGPTGPVGPTGPAGPPGQNGVVALAAVWAPGALTARAGKSLKVRYAVTSDAALQARLAGKKTLTKKINAKAGTNTLKWKLPKKLKTGKYNLQLLHQGTVKAKTKVKITR